MKFEFNAEKYAAGSGDSTVDFQGRMSTIVDGKTFYSYPVVSLKNGDNEITEETYKTLQNRADYETLLKDGVFTVKSTASAKPTTDDSVVIKTDSKPPKTESPNRALPTV